MNKGLIKKLLTILFVVVLIFSIVLFSGCAEKKSEVKEMEETEVETAPAAADSIVDTLMQEAGEEVEEEME